MSPLKALTDALVCQGTGKSPSNGRSVSSVSTMASEVSKLIDDELQKEGRDESSRLLPGQGVKARCRPSPCI